MSRFRDISLRCYARISIFREHAIAIVAAIDAITQTLPYAHAATLISAMSSVCRYVYGLPLFCYVYACYSVAERHC